MEEKHWIVLKALGFGLLSLCLAFTSGTMIVNGNILLTILTSLVALWCLWQAILQATLIGAILTAERAAEIANKTYKVPVVEEGQ